MDEKADVGAAGVGRSLWSLGEVDTFGFAGSLLIYGVEVAELFSTEFLLVLKIRMTGR